MSFPLPRRFVRGFWFFFWLCRLCMWTLYRERDREQLVHPSWVSQFVNIGGVLTEQYGRLSLELFSIVLEIPNDAYTTLSQNLIGCSAFSWEYRKLIGWYWKTMRRELWTSTCPIKNVDLHKASHSRFVFLNLFVADIVWYTNRHIHSSIDSYNNYSYSDLCTVSCCQYTSSWCSNQSVLE